MMPPIVQSPPTTISTLQLGMGWLPEQPGNGLDRVYHALAQHLPDAGVSVRGLVVGSEEVARSSDGTIRAFASDDASLFARLRGIRRHLQRLRSEDSFDLVATHFPLYAAPVLDLIRDRPLVVHFHGPWALESEAEGASWPVARAKAGVERFLYHRADRFIVLSEAFRTLLCSTYDVPGHRVRIVPGGVDTARFDVAESKAEARTALGWPRDRPILLSVRRLAQRMGLENLIDAVSRLRTHVPDILLYIAGKGPLRDALRTQIERLDLQDHVRLLGFVPDDDLPRAYRAADLSVVPTLKLEGFGLITVESLAAGTPVLATPVGGLPETLRPLSEALVLPDTSTETLTDTLHRVLVGRLSLPSTEECRTYARDRFDWSTVAQNVRTVYENLL